MSTTPPLPPKTAPPRPPVRTPIQQAEFVAEHLAGSWAKWSVEFAKVHRSPAEMVEAYLTIRDEIVAHPPGQH